MNVSSVIALLQLAASLLVGAQGSTTSVTDMQHALALSNQAIQQAVQLEVMPTINFSIPKNNSIWPNAADLRDTAYLSPDGGYVLLGSTVGLLDGDTSFGDMNGDGLDDAAAIVQRTDKNGKITTMLAAMLNQNGILFNITDAQLGDATQIIGHHIIQGGDIVLNTQVGTGVAVTSTYRLVGAELIKIN